MPYEICTHAPTRSCLSLLDQRPAGIALQRWLGPSSDSTYHLWSYYVEPPERFELPALAFEARCSIH